MNPTITLPLSQQTADLVLAEHADRMISLRADLLLHRAELADVINAYLSERYRVAEEPEIHVHFGDKLTGRLLINFNASQYNACDSQELTIHDDRWLDFQISADAASITLSGGPVPERSTFEEF